MSGEGLLLETVEGADTLLEKDLEDLFALVFAGQFFICELTHFALFVILRFFVVHPTILLLRFHFGPKLLGQVVFIFLLRFLG